MSDKNRRVPLVFEFFLFFQIGQGKEKFELSRDFYFTVSKVLKYCYRREMVKKSPQGVSRKENFAFRDQKVKKDHTFEILTKSVYFGSSSRAIAKILRKKTLHLMVKREKYVQTYQNKGGEENWLWLKSAKLCFILSFHKIYCYFLVCTRNCCWCVLMPEIVVVS